MTCVRHSDRATVMVGQDCHGARIPHILEARTQPEGLLNEIRHGTRTWTHPVQLGDQPVYANFDTSGGDVVLQEVPWATAHHELEDDCTKAYTRHIGTDSPVAPTLGGAKAIVAVQPLTGSSAVFVGPVAARACRFSSDCGEGSDYSCRGWRGQQVCMGHGGAGAPCAFSSDCLSGSCDSGAQVCR